MASFELSYNRVARAEGGYQDHPNDSGNYNSLKELVGTNWGINAQVYESYLGRPPGKNDMQTMSRATAKAIYRKKYWNRIKGDHIHDQYVADLFFDGHVNHGFTGIRLMQKVLRVGEDGIVGPQTLNAINEASAPLVYQAYKNIRIAFYHRLVEVKPKLAVFLKGWLKRITSFIDYVNESSGSASSPSRATSSGASFGPILWPLLLLIPLFLKR